MGGQRRRQGNTTLGGNFFNNSYKYVSGDLRLRELTAKKAPGSRRDVMTSIFDVPLEESVDTLKRVLPLMTAQKVPTIPQNYAIWYDYVTNRNDELSRALESYIEDGRGFDAEACRSFYQRFFLAEINAEVDAIQNAVRDAVGSMLNELGSLGDGVGRYAGVLDDCGQRLKADISPEDLQTLITAIADETARAQQQNVEAENALKAMSNELNELRSQVDRLSRDSRTDPLTGVGNRRSFDEALTQLTREAKSNNTPLCLIMADIDFFKVFNDTHGHPLGDKVLRSVAIEIEQCVKGRDRLARYGGEEFAILLPATPLPGAILLAESIRAIIEVLRVRDFDGNEVEPVTLSLGVSQLRPEEDSLQFLNRADDCLYLSKQNGRNCVSDESQLNPH